MSTKHLSTTPIRWLIRRDMPFVLEIEKSFDIFTTEEEIVGHLRQRNCIGMVYEDTSNPDNPTIKGYMIYELHKDSLGIIKMVVHPDYRRQGIGSAMINKLIDKLSMQRRKHLFIDVREGNKAVYFLKKQGFTGKLVQGDKWDIIDMMFELKEQHV